jgi:ankyrin repeat protein
VLGWVRVLFFIFNLFKKSFFIFIILKIKGNESVVDILLQNGASVDACDSEGRTALRAAVFSGHEHIVKLLLNYSADGESNNSGEKIISHREKRYNKINFLFRVIFTQF